MSGAALSIVLGVAVVAYGGWYVPRALRQVSERAHARGGNPERIDTLLASRVFRTLLPVCGGLLILVGVWLLATDN
jgi:hypothetical protein